MAKRKRRRNPPIKVPETGRMRMLARSVLYNARQYVRDLDLAVHCSEDGRPDDSGLYEMGADRFLAELKRAVRAYDLARQASERMERKRLDEVARYEMLRRSCPV